IENLVERRAEALDDIPDLTVLLVEIEVIGRRRKLDVRTGEALHRLQLARRIALHDILDEVRSRGVTAEQTGKVAHAALAGRAGHWISSAGSTASRPSSA